MRVLLSLREGGNDDRGGGKRAQQQHKQTGTGAATDRRCCSGERKGVRTRSQTYLKSGICRSDVKEKGRIIKGKAGELNQVEGDCTGGRR